MSVFCDPESEQSTEVEGVDGILFSPTKHAIDLFGHRSPPRSARFTRLPCARTAPRPAHPCAILLFLHHAAGFLMAIFSRCRIPRCGPGLKRDSNFLSGIWSGVSSYFVHIPLVLCHGGCSSFLPLCSTALKRRERTCGPSPRKGSLGTTRCRSKQISPSGRRPETSPLRGYRHAETPLSPGDGSSPALFRR